MKIKKSLAYFVLIITSFSSCKDEISEQNANDVTAFSDEGITTLGDKIENPYSLSIMQQAYENLYANSSEKIIEQLTISPSHYYIRFLPKDSADVDSLESLFGEILYDYPLDYEIKSEGNFYQDPSIPYGQPTWRYTALPADYSIPTFIRHEILDELFIPEPDTIINSSNERIAMAEFLDELENEAYRITGTDYDVPNANGRTEGKKWNPSGTITVTNDFSKVNEGVPFIIGRARKVVKIKTSYTDKNGYFRLPSFKGKVNYSLKYKNGNARIKANWYSLTAATKNGPKQKGHWTYNKGMGSREYLWGVIMRGVYDYIFEYMQRYNIGRPPVDLKIRACENKDCRVTTMLHSRTWLNRVTGIGLFSDIRIGNKYDRFDIIYKTTIHELGHAAHWNYVGDNWIAKSAEMALAHKMVREAWACGVTDVIYKDRFGRPYYEGCKELQSMIDDGYPRVVIRDLIDNINEYNSSDSDCNVYDPVNLKGFTLKEIFQALKGVRAINRDNAMKDWRDNLKTKKPALSDLLDDYFEQYEK